MHERFDAALASVRERLGARHALFLDGADVPSSRYVTRGAR